MKDTNFKTELKALLKSKGITQGELAEMLGVSQAAVSQFTNPALSTIQDICKALHVPF
ncbi:MAG: helix-turn-helix transcriptional regulator, partial [Sinomicrobium sp.]|nr:helix-turn-helix transcriptional regulator [Sinomicrobium sp.]